MSGALEGLHGVQFVRSGWLEQSDRWNNDSSYIQHLIAAEQEITETVRQYGGVVLSSLDEIDTGQPWYRLDLDYDNNREVLEQQLAAHNNTLSLLPNQLLSQLADDDISILMKQLSGEPFVLAYNQYARGHGKYLIEHRYQLERILRLQADFPNTDFAAHCEIRPFIETPSDRDTSFRVDVSATGKLLSAALVYSAHTKDSRPVVTRDRWEDLLQEDVEIRFLQTKFEDPDSPYYLNARSPRSNISTGGGLIPLMGPGSVAEISPDEKKILEAHRIDPCDRKVPSKIIESTSLIGSTVGRHLHPVIGIDILPPGWIIDINPGPGVKTYAECWPEPGADVGRNVVRQRLAAIATIAAGTPL